MSALVSGLAGGLVATILMTVVMRAMGGGPPPTAQLVSKFGDGSPADYPLPGLVLHLVYGVVAGGVFAVGAPLVGLSLNSPTFTTVLGVVYGVALMVGGMAFWLRGVLGVAPDRATLQTFGVVHVIYGGVLGAVVGAGILA